MTYPSQSRDFFSRTFYRAVWTSAVFLLLCSDRIISHGDGTLLLTGLRNNLRQPLHLGPTRQLALVKEIYDSFALPLNMS